MNEKHTPGPWLVTGNRIYAKPTGESQDICRTDEGNAFSDIERAANTRLLAAAPEMLEALIRLFNDTIRRHADNNCRCESCESYEQARAAIAKAVGDKIP